MTTIPARSIAVLVLFTGAPLNGSGLEETPRVPLAKVAVVSPNNPESERVFPVELVVKFQDHLRVRVGTDGSLYSLAGTDLSAVQDLAQKEDLNFAPLIQLAPDVLHGLEQRAALASGKQQPDLGGMHKVVLDGATEAQLLQIGEQLQSMAQVEFCELEARQVPPPDDYPPTTAPMHTSQLHMFGDPGMGFNQAFARGATGAGVRISDCEYSWDLIHEDLVDQNIMPEPGQTPASPFPPSHGTAVLGVYAAGRNGYGMDGATSEASFAVYTEDSVEEGPRRAAAITSAIADSQPGDVVLLEMQTVWGGSTFVPAEVNQSVWTVVRLGTDAGVVIVAAVGNGGTNLDDPLYDEYAARGDSGSILVGAGSPTVNHYRMVFSTFGSRIDMQAWGDLVATLTYDHTAMYPHQAYTAYFAGTSSASALVAAAVAAVQSFSKLNSGTHLPPVDMRALLKATGIPQQSPLRNIGPIPDINSAMDVLECIGGIAYCTANPNSNGTIGRMGMEGTSRHSHNDLILRAFDCSPNNFGIFLFGPEPGQTVVGNGLLCIAAPWRIGISAIQADGSASLVFDNGPLPGSPYVVSPNTNWAFQFWYRDGTTSNFTNGMQVQFCP